MVCLTHLYRESEEKMFGQRQMRHNGVKQLLARVAGLRHHVETLAAE